MPSRAWDTRSPTSASSSATTRRRPPSTPLPGALRIEGAALRKGPVSFSYPELLRLHSREITAFVECAGNGRSFFGSQQGTPAAGTGWGLGAFGVARWRGVPLSVLLDRARVPIGKALDDALVALEMNGEPLPPDHGFPARLIVPGWIGVASMKWLGRIEVSDAPLPRTGTPSSTASPAAGTRPTRRRSPNRWSRAPGSCRGRRPHEPGCRSR